MPSLTVEREEDLQGDQRMKSATPRGRSLPRCAVCGDSVVAAESSALGLDGEVKYLWSCETCGLGFVTSFRAETCH